MMGGMGMMGGKGMGMGMMPYYGGMKGGGMMYGGGYGGGGYGGGGGFNAIGQGGIMQFFFMRKSKSYTGDSLYLKVQGARQNTSRYQ